MKSLSQSSHGCQVQMGSSKTKRNHSQPLRIGFKLYLFVKVLNFRNSSALIWNPLSGLIIGPLIGLSVVPLLLRAISTVNCVILNFINKIIWLLLYAFSRFHYVHIERWLYYVIWLLFRVDFRIARVLNSESGVFLQTEVISFWPFWTLTLVESFEKLWN